jgi:hypothetical protein
MTPEGPPAEPEIGPKTRALLVAPVEIEYTADKSTESTFTANVSLEGFFILTSNPRPVGTKLRFELKIQREGHSVKGFGEVRWIRVRDEGLGKPAGTGILIGMLIGEEGETVLRDAIGGAIKATSLTGSPVPAPALDLDSPEARMALTRAREPEEAPEAAPATPPADEVIRQQGKEFGYGRHAERAAELRSKRLGTRKRKGATKLDELTSRLGFSSKLYLLFLPIIVLLVILVFFVW